MKLSEYIVKVLAECAGTDTKEITFDIPIQPQTNGSLEVVSNSTNRVQFTVAVGRKEP